MKISLLKSIFNMKENLFGKTLSELEDIVLGLGQKKFVAKQIANWLYQKDVRTIEEMSNLSKGFRSLLNEQYEIGLSAAFLWGKTRKPS